MRHVILLLISCFSLTGLSPAAVIGHWSFDTDYSDVSGNGWNGTLTDVDTTGNSGITNTAGESMFGGGALNLSGDKDYVGITDTWVSGTGYSIAFWAKDRNAVNDQDGMVIGKNSTTNDFIWLEGKFGGMRYRAGTSTYTADFATGAEDTAWHHYVVVAGGGNVTCYKDGVFKGTATGKGYGMSINAIGHAYSGTQNYDYDGMIDEVWVFDEMIDMDMVLALYRTNGEVGVIENPTPNNGQDDVVINQTFSWQLISDPNINTSYVPQYRFFMDPNKINVETGALNCRYYHDFQSGNSYDPPSDLAYETPYFWRVDTKLKWNGKTDPNEYIGKVWEFTTVSAAPADLTGPADTKVAAGETARLTVTYTSINPVTTVTWYKNGMVLDPLADPDLGITYDNTTTLLSIANADAADEGIYSCEVTSTPGGTVSSETGQLVLKTILAWYQFEQNLTDSAGTNHGTLNGPEGGLTYAEDKPVHFDTQFYAADPDGSVYAQLPADAYPKAGFGSGLEEGTISFWFKADPAETGYILGSYNTGTKTALHIGIGTDDNPGKVHTNIRDEEGGPSFTSGKSISDNEWHHAALILTPAGFVLYTDVTDTVSRTGTMDHYADWQYPMVLMARNLRGVIGGNFSGRVDDLRIYNYAWTQLEVAQEYYRGTNIRTCAAPYASEYDFANAATGLTIGDTGFIADCRIDLADFAALSLNAWMTCGLYPLEACN